MFLHVSCSSQTLSLPGQAVRSLACFLVIVSALKPVPLRRCSMARPLPAPSWTARRGSRAQGSAGWGCRGLARLWGRRHGRLLIQASLILPVSSDIPPLLVTRWPLAPPEQCIRRSRLGSTACVQPASVTDLSPGNARSERHREHHPAVRSAAGVLTRWPIALNRGPSPGGKLHACGG